MDDNGNSQDSATQPYEIGAWIKAIRYDERMPEGVKYVLQNIGWTYPGPNGDLLYARQTTIADELRVSIRLVKKAYAEAKRLGYFVSVKRAARGRGLHSPDTYKLVIPRSDPGAQYAPGSADPGARSDLSGCMDRPIWVHEVTDLGARTEALTSDSDTIKGEKKGLNKGEEEGTKKPPPPALQGNPPLAPLAQNGNPFKGIPREGHWLGINTKLAMAEKPINHEWSIDDSPLGGIHPITWQEFLLADYPTTPVKRPSQYCDKHTDDATPCHGCKAQKALVKKWDSVFQDWISDYGEWFTPMKNCEYCRDSDGKYTNDQGLWWCEHPESLPDDHGRDYDWNAKPVESVD
jgi:hypothetical protein